MKNMDLGIEKLKEIGVDAINSKTKIAHSTIESILDREFDKLNYVRARGFVGILEREYDLDLSDWIAQYTEYLAQRDEELKSESEILDTQKLDDIKKIKTRYLYFGVSMILLLLVVSMLTYFFFANKRAIDSEPAKPEVKQEVEHTQSNLNDVSVVPQQEASPKDDVTNNSPANLPASLPTTNAVENKKTKNGLKPVFREFSDYGVNIVDKNNDVLGVDGGDSFENGRNSLVLDSNSDLWLGIIDLGNKSRVAQIKKHYSIPLDKDMLIVSGHGYFHLSVNDRTKKMSTHKNVFLFFTKEHGLKQITKEEFMGINGGSEW